MKNILKVVAALTFTSSVIAGSDDRDSALIKSLDTPIMLAPIMVESSAVNQKSSVNKDLNGLKLKVGGKAVSVSAHIACQDKIGLSESNIAIFKVAKSGDYLYNTGPLDLLGTNISTNRWDSYFDCVDEYGV